MAHFKKEMRIDVFFLKNFTVGAKTQNFAVIFSSR